MGATMGAKTMRLIILVWAGFVFAGVCGNTTDTVALASRSKSFFNSFPLSPLTVVRISNEKCTAGSGRSGTCMAKTECVRKGGSLGGICGQGFGVCCVMVAVENGVAYGNNTLLLKTSFNAGVDITYTILRMNDDICQYRLDVTNLFLYKVGNDGICFHDWMTVNQDTKFQKVCAMTRDVHYYIDVVDKFTIFTFHTDPGQSFDRSWEIYVSQYTCDMGAPEGCGQWYQGASGKIDIWNNIEPQSDPWVYIENQNYAICVRWEAGYCTITYYEPIRFQPSCNDLFERPGNTVLQGACIFTPPSTSITYTLNGGLQYFYVAFTDNSNQHLRSNSNPFKNPSIFYTQNLCT